MTTRLLGTACIAALAVACAGRAASVAPTASDVEAERREVTLGAGRVRFDLYRAGAPGPRPLVVVAHGFWRSRANMSGWGRHLAGEGFLVAVPDLPAWSDHERNARAISELVDWLLAQPPLAIDDRRVGVVGFSAGGLSTLLAAARNPRIRLWVGLDPVDRDGKGALAAQTVSASALILRATPSRCNAHGNAVGIERAFGGRATTVSVAGATHTDPEWPSDWKARLVCGADAPERRAKFVDAATAALKSM